MSRNEHLTYLFDDTALADLKRFINRTTLFAFDLDGTLAPIVSNTGAIGIPDAILAEFAILNTRATVAVITGRFRADALLHLGITPRYLIGNHGAEGLPGWETREDEFVRTTKEWQHQLDVLLPIDDRDGIVIENKGATLSIHYRHASHREVAHALILRAVNRLVPHPRRVGGKCIESLIPDGAPDKGVALMHLMHQAGCPKGFFIGDDETDEDVFRLDHENLFTVRVEKRTGSRARYYLRQQHEITRLLRDINRILGTTEGSATR